MSDLHIRIERSGGFAGTTTSRDVVRVDEIERLLAALPADGLTGTGSPDRFVYRIEIDREGEIASRDVLEFAERDLPLEARRLIAELLRTGS